ncbi:hypothetical protein E2C01_077653 [Portunus trituberculatus]|uniref:Uncharacterized protein n=1 Tax=Portunus trituberculatus TaxID=210409 RepID=A0A5B7IS22_PORTR|nr:hypothetical protein [Portunus trituberculatus]
MGSQARGQSIKLDNLLELSTGHSAVHASAVVSCQIEPYVDALEQGFLNRGSPGTLRFRKNK